MGQSQRGSAMQLTLLFWTVLLTSHSFVASNSSPGGKEKKPGSLGGKHVSGSGSSGEGSGLDEGSGSGEGSALDGNKMTLRHFKEPAGNRWLFHKPGWWRGGSHKNEGRAKKHPAPPKLPVPAPPKQGEPKVLRKWKLRLANGTIIMGSGALPEIWVLNDSSEGSSGTRDGSYNSFPPSFGPGSGEAPEEDAHSDGSGHGRGGYEPYYRSGGAPNDGRWGGYEPEPYYRSGGARSNSSANGRGGYEPEPYYRSGGAGSDGSGNGRGGYEPEPYYRRGGAPSNGRWGYEPEPYYRSGGAHSDGRWGYKPYYRSGGAPSNGSGNGGVMSLSPIIGVVEHPA